MADTQTYLSLFTGAGGLDIGLRIAVPGARCLGFCEREFSAIEILAARMEEGTIEVAPVFTDVRTFPGRLYCGRVAGIIGGFPCTDLSVAGKQAGLIKGQHSSLWFEYLRIIREVQPEWVAIENVPAVIAFPAGGIVLSGLAEAGFDAEWLSIRASDVGASHSRLRVFVLAPKSSRGRRVLWQSSERYGLADGSYPQLADAQEVGRHRRRQRGECGSGEVWQQSPGVRQSVADAGDGLLPQPWREPEGRDGAGPADAVLDADRNRRGAGTLADAGRTGQRRSEEPDLHQHRARTPADDAGGVRDLADADPERLQGQWPDRDPEGREGSIIRSAGLHDGAGDVADSSGAGLPIGDGQGRGTTGQCAAEPERGGGYDREEVADTDSEDCGWLTDASRISGRTEPRVVVGRDGSRFRYDLPLFAPGPGATEQWQRVLHDHPYLSPAISKEEVESAFHGVADAMAHMVVHERTDALRACGNGCVPVQVAVALRILASRIELADADVSS